MGAARPELAEPLVEEFIESAVGLGCPLKVVSLGPTWMSHCAMMAQ